MKRFSLLIILLCTLFISSSEMNNNVKTITNNETSPSDYAMYSFENVDYFKNYLQELGIDLYNNDDVIKLAENFDKLYDNAIKKGIIKKLIMIFY